MTAALSTACSTQARGIGVSQSVEQTALSNARAAALWSQLPQRKDVPANLPFANLAVHMVGIGGSGMSGLAAILLRRGAQVSGTDARMSITLARLMGAGASVTAQQTADALPSQVDLVVASAAIADDHPELLEARRRGVTVVKYACMLGAIMNRFDGVAISGTHGKSTTTSWLAYLLRETGFDPNFVVGAEVAQLGGGSGVGDGNLFVAEACEYDRSFLNLWPRRAVILNIEEDHLDCYADIAAIRRAFADFAALLPAEGLLVLNGRDENCKQVAAAAGCRVETFGEDESDIWRALNVTAVDGHYAFDVQYKNRDVGRFEIGLPGRHNVWNALAVMALAHDCGVRFEQMRRPLANFSGAKRRLELRQELNGIRIVDDYAHHPTEIQATLEAARERYRPRKLWVVFQPHQHSRTRFLLDDFSRSFDHADFVVVPDIYFVRDSQRDCEAVSASDLVQRICDRGGTAEYLADFEQIVAHLARNVQPGDVVLTMGAGNIWKVADELVLRLGGKLPA